MQNDYFYISARELISKEPNYYLTIWDENPDSQHGYIRDFMAENWIMYFTHHLYGQSDDVNKLRLCDYVTVENQKDKLTGDSIPYKMHYMTYKQTGKINRERKNRYKLLLAGHLRKIDDYEAKLLLIALNNIKKYRDLRA